MLHEARLADGSTLEYAEDGDPGGRPVVVQPGTPGTADTGALVDDAARRHGVRLISISRPGYGASTSAPPGLTVVARQVEQLADLLGIERFGVWGMSGGGPYALAQAVVTPARTTRLVVGGGPAPVREGDDTAALTAEAVTLRERFAGLDPVSFVAAMAPTDHFRRHPEGAAAFLAQVRRGLTRPDGYVRDNLSWHEPWDVDLAAISCPVDLIYGEADALTPLADGQRLSQLVPRAAFTVVTGADHGNVVLGAAEHVLGLLTVE